MDIIVSCDLNWGIGKNGDLLTTIPEDMRFFKETTMGGVVIMGRKTLESLPGQRPLPGRVNIVITSSGEYEKKGFITVNGIDEAIKKASEYKPKNVFVIGGGNIYHQFLPVCDTAYVTRFYKDFEADTFFENLDENPDWETVSESCLKSCGGTGFKFIKYKRREGRGK